MLPGITVWWIATISNQHQDWEQCSHSSIIPQLWPITGWRVWEHRYRIAGKFGGEFNLADWRIWERIAKLNSANISWCHLVGGVWKLLTTSVRDECEASFEDGVVQVLYKRAPDIPYESPLSFRQTKSKKRTQKWSVRKKGIPLGAASTTNIRQKKEHRLESLPLNMDPQRQSDISQSFCPGKFSFLYTAQPPYFPSIECSNWAERSGYVYVAWQSRMTSLLAKTKPPN